MSDTPRTDAHYKAQTHTYSPSVSRDFARTLELENQQLRTVVEALIDEFGDWNRPKEKQLPEIRNAMNLLETLSE